MTIKKPNAPQRNVKLNDKVELYEDLLNKRIPREIERIMQDCDDLDTVADLEWFLNNIKGAID